MAHKLTFLLSSGFELLDLSGPLCAFDCARAFYDAPYEISVSSFSGGLVACAAGLSISTTKWSKPGHDDTIIVVGGPNIDPDTLSETAGCLRALAPFTQRIASICTGAFYLAEAGILDGRRATTHWRWAPALQAKYPPVRVDADRIYINEGNIWTSAGITAGIDLALALIEADCGRDMSKIVARDLLVYHRRSGGQSQYSTILDLAPSSSRVREALIYAREHLLESLPVERLAEVACLSSRQFSRLFLKETGETPARAVERLRAEIALARVEDSNEPIENIADDVGFGDIERMRRSFLRVHGQSPQSLRRIARSHAAQRG